MMALFFFLPLPALPRSTLFPYTTLFRSVPYLSRKPSVLTIHDLSPWMDERWHHAADRKSTRLNSSHRCISYAVFCLKKKNISRRCDDGGLLSFLKSIHHLFFLSSGLLYN